MKRKIMLFTVLILLAYSVFAQTNVELKKSIEWLLTLKPTDFKNNKLDITRFEPYKGEDKGYALFEKTISSESPEIIVYVQNTSIEGIYKIVYTINNFPFSEDSSFNWIEVEIGKILGKPAWKVMKGNNFQTLLVWNINGINISYEYQAFSASDSENIPAFSFLTLEPGLPRERIEPIRLLLSFDSKPTTQFVIILDKDFNSVYSEKGSYMGPLEVLEDYYIFSFGSGDNKINTKINRITGIVEFTFPSSKSPTMGKAVLANEKKF